jgi:ABC-type antimicrobial peptide transport system permease subunit
VDYLTLFIASTHDPASLSRTLRPFIRSADPLFTSGSATTFRQHMRSSRSSEQLAAQVSGALALVGLLLAAAGLFGVTLNAVARRTPEFGVRVAVGATPARLAGQILREASWRIAIALPLGWGIAYASRSALEKLLYGVAPDDPWTFILTSGVVSVVGCVAALHPAIRAARIDPMLALRHQ